MKVRRLSLIERDPWLIELCQGKSVLHLGCTDHPLTQNAIAQNRLLHCRLARSARVIVGVDIDESGIGELRQLMPGHEFIVFNAEEMTHCPALATRRFDVVVAADVFEHISNAGRFLESARSVLAPGGRLLLTTPHAFSAKRFGALALFGTEHVHEDHTAYFSLSTLERILNRHHLRVTATYGFQWHNPTLRNTVANALVKPLLTLSAGRLCDELAIVAESTN